MFCTTRDLSSNQTLWRDFSYLSTSTGWCRTSHKSTWIPPLKHLDRSSNIWAVVKTAGAVLWTMTSWLTWILILTNVTSCLYIYIYIQWGSLYIYIYTCNFHLWKQTNKPFWHSMSHPGSLISESNISWLMKLSPHNLVVSHPPKPTQATREPFFHSGPGPNFWLRWRYEPLEDLPFRQHVVSKMKGSVFFFFGDSFKGPRW